VVEEVAEAAVVPVAHDIKGKVPDLYIALKPGFEASAELAQKISEALIMKSDPSPNRARSGSSRHAQDPFGQDHAPVLGAISNKGMWAT
jgi:acetyl-CoA synthetase